MTLEDEELRNFLIDLEPMSTETVLWRGGQIELELTGFITDMPPPDNLVTSGRCIVLSDTSVLMMHNPSGSHILPGGRRQPGESTRSAAVREVAEETGLSIDPPEQLGVMVFRHLTPKPVIYPYPYPVFINVVYVTHVPETARIAVNDTYELAGEFVSPRDDAVNGLPPHQRQLLSAALRLPQGASTG